MFIVSLRSTIALFTGPSVSSQIACLRSCMVLTSSLPIEPPTAAPTGPPRRPPATAPTPKPAARTPPPRSPIPAILDAIPGPNARANCPAVPSPPVLAKKSAERAAWFAVTDASDQIWRPDTFQSRFQQGWVQSVVGANPHALAATDTAPDECLFVKRPRWPYQQFRTIDFERISRTEHRDRCQTAGYRGYYFSARGIDFGRTGRIGFRFDLIREKLKTERPLRTRRLTVQTEMTLGLAPAIPDIGVVRTLTVLQAEVAMVAGRLIFFETEYGKS